MTPLRLLAAVAASAAIAGTIAGVFGPRPPPAAAPPSPPPAAVDPSPGAPRGPARFTRSARPQVPAGILARAANARALERAPSCPPQAEEREAPRCAPERPESIEIEWHVGHDR